VQAARGAEAEAFGSIVWDFPCTRRLQRIAPFVASSPGHIENLMFEQQHTHAGSGRSLRLLQSST
jgi:hypothetical protein